MFRSLGVAAASVAAAVPAVAQDPKPVPAPVPAAPASKPAQAPIHFPASADPQSVAGPVGNSTTACDTLCAPPVCDPCGGCAWISAEWLFWTVQGQGLPPLVSASPVGTPRANAGVLGTPGARVLYGGSRANDDLRSGLRLSGGVWLNSAHTLGLGGDFVFLEDARERFQAGSPGTPGSAIISRPFTSTANGGTPASQLVAFPGVLSGGVTVNTTSRFIGGGPTLFHNLCCSCSGRLDLIHGFRYYGLSDDVRVVEDLTAIDPAGPAVPNTRIVVQDRFRTENDFYGGFVGLAGERRAGNWVIGGRAQVGLGGTRRVVRIDGSTATTPPGGPRTLRVGGLLAQGTNIGRYADDTFSVVPEAGLRVGYQVTPAVRLFVGYDILFWSDVLRAGDQIDPVVNTTQIPPGPLVGPARPAFRPRETTVWVQGVSVGVQLRY